MVVKGIKDYDFILSNSMLSNAVSWGVKILHIDGKKSRYGHPESKNKWTQKTFCKDGTSQLYRPFYLQLTNTPFINYSNQKHPGPFDVDKPFSIQKQAQNPNRWQ